MVKRNRWYDKVVVKVTLATAIISFVAGVISLTYKYAEDQTKKELGINKNEQAIERIERAVEMNSRKLDRLSKYMRGRNE